MHVKHSGEGFAPVQPSHSRASVVDFEAATLQTVVADVATIVAGESPVGVPLVGAAPIVDGVFVARPNQFIVEARLTSGEDIRAHCADRGRLRWLVPGTPLLLGIKHGVGRKTAFQVAAAWTEDAWASLDTHLPNRLIESALCAGALSQFHGYNEIKREARFGHSRFDFRLEGAGQACYIEVKSVGTARDGLALFPDAPTERGTRHLAELATLAASGVRAALIFVAQHARADAVMSDRRVDPRFANALLAAADDGVEVYAYRCPITRDGIRLEQIIPCLLA
jgi:sugar fermentation stimulation protein A